LTSPSASEASSRMSLETRFSENPSIFSASRVRPRGMGHARQVSSAGLQLPATIREQPSMATLRANRCSSSPPRVQVVGWDGDVTVEKESAEKAVKCWLSFQREADDEYKRTKYSWQDSEESKHAVAGESIVVSRLTKEADEEVEFRVPTSPAEIATFLAKSSQAYKPLEQLPQGRTAHRRKSSLSDARLLTSPYGLPLPKPPQPYATVSALSKKVPLGLPQPKPHNIIPDKKKGSLQTKYERTNSSTSSHFSGISDEDPIPPPPVSAVFAKFTRELPVSPPPKLAAVTPFSPFQLPGFESTGKMKSDVSSDEKAREKAEMEKRERVDSNVRRVALGWGRRRNSDGPVKVVEAESKAGPRRVVGGKPTATMGRAAVYRDQENMIPST
jgi:serine/arginine repetitive matrix protein 2